MKAMLLLSSLLYMHTALAMTDPGYGRIKRTSFAARTPHTNTVAVMNKTYAHFLPLPELRSKHAHPVRRCDDHVFLCDFLRRERNDDWSADNAGSIIARTVTTVPSDVIGITAYPVAHFNETKIFAGVTAALLITDRKTTWFVQNNLEPTLNNIDFPHLPRLFNSTLLAGTDSYLVVGLGALYAGSLALSSERGQVAALLSYKSIAYSVLFTHLILKTITARKRPFDPLEGPEAVEEPYTRNQYDFFNFHRPYVKANANATSFPSFHFTLWFASARVLHKVYNNAFIPYTLCALALADGFGSHDHWVSDMVAGAMVGIAIGNVVTDSFLQKNSSRTSMAPQRKNYFSVSLIPEPSCCSLCLKYHF